MTVAEALAAGDVSALEPLLAADAVFHSPVADYPGRPLALRVLSAVAQVLDDVEIVSSLGDDEQRVTVLRARELDAMVRELARGGEVYDVTLMVRPLDALQRAIERMQELLSG